MPTLHFIAKDKVVNHHLDVPFKVLEQNYAFGENPDSGNKIIHGDNLEALKALLPEYEGKVKCIYIDPPYNTGNEGWVYNDKVNHPKIEKWLGDVVGKEGDDLTRHDKWLCMMYPRLKLLQRLMSDDGMVFISIDDNEYQNLKCICDEIFGRSNFITNFTWRTDGNFDNQAKIKINHEYILTYAKRIDFFEYPKVVDPNISDGSKLFKSEIRNTIVKNGPKNPISEVVLPIGFPCDLENGIIKARENLWPHYKSDAIVQNHQLKNEVIVCSGWSSKSIFEEFIRNNFRPVKDSKGQETTFVISKTGAIENIKLRGDASHVVSSLYNMGSTQNMSGELKRMGISFDYPKPVTLIEYLISIINDQNIIVLDSFAGSGTTAHAVLNLNKQDGGARKFILVEMEDYADTVTAERVKRVIKGYGGKEGTGGSFGFYRLGPPLFAEDGNLNEEAGTDNIRRYVWYTETKTAFTEPPASGNPFFLGMHNDTAYYFFYEPGQITSLSHEFLATIKTRAGQYVIYADNCLLTGEFLTLYHIIFKKIPRDVTRF